jgi:purine-nucleoside phosphorylase
MPDLESPRETPETSEASEASAAPERPEAPTDSEASPALNDAIALSAQRLRSICAGNVPRLALLLGSGWAPVGQALEAQAEVDYDHLPAFPALSVSGHAGRVRVGRIAGVDVLLLSGRKHTYEDGDCAAMKGAIRTLAAAGVTTLVQTNAAGSLDAAMPPGALMLVTDHLNLPQRSPLVGDDSDHRFVDMGQAYDPALAAAADAAADMAGLTLHQGVYAWMLGPQFETPAEIRMLQRLGAQAVGMSTVPETILARHAGLKVLALSMITNMGCGLSSEALSHAHTLHHAERAAADATQLVTALLPAIEPLL